MTKSKGFTVTSEFRVGFCERYILVALGVKILGGTISYHVSKLQPFG